MESEFQIKQNFANLQKHLSALKTEKNITRDITLVAVTKYHPLQILQICKNIGIAHIAESRVQEMSEKFSLLPNLKPNFKKHFIGSLQKNKIKYLIGTVDTIDSVSSLSLLEAIENQFENRGGNKVEVLLQINSTQESQKGGLDIHQVQDIKPLVDFTLQAKHIVLSGLMTMGPTPQNDEHSQSQEYLTATRDAFARCADLFAQLKPLVGESFTRLSMGMSDDYHIAIEQGATEIRVGSLLFGNRR